MSVARAPSHRHSMCLARCTFVVRSLVRQQRKNHHHYYRRNLELDSEEMSTSMRFCRLRFSTVAQYWPTRMCRLPYLLNNNNNKDNDDINLFFYYCVHSCPHHICYAIVHICFSSVRTLVLHSPQWCDERSTFGRWCCRHQQ